MFSFPLPDWMMLFCLHGNRQLSLFNAFILLRLLYIHAAHWLVGQDRGGVSVRESGLALWVLKMRELNFIISDVWYTFLLFISIKKSERYIRVSLNNMFIPSYRCVIHLLVPRYILFLFLTFDCVGSEWSFCFSSPPQRPIWPPTLKDFHPRCYLLFVLS